MKLPTYPVSIIVPIYKVEQYIEKCLHSLFLQTYPHIEYIFVDDKGGDNSINILYEVMKKYPDRIDDIRIVHHASNKGLSAARNTGIQASTGKYILQIDSDDYVEIDMVEKMYTEAIQQDADIVIADYYKEFLMQSIYCKECSTNTVFEKISHILLREFDFNTPMVWNKLIKRSLYLDYNIKCIEGCDLGEDTIVMPQLLYYASNIVHLKEAFVHYVQYNPNSITRQIKAYYGFLINLSALENIFKKLQIEYLFKDCFIQRKWIITSSVLCSSISHRDKKLWIKNLYIHYPSLKINFFKLPISIFQKIILWLYILNLSSIAEFVFFIYKRVTKKLYFCLL